jgi:hypothetical protein
MLIALTLIGVALVSVAVAYFRPKLTRIATIVTDVSLCFACRYLMLFTRDIETQSRVYYTSKVVFSFARLRRLGRIHDQCRNARVEVSHWSKECFPGKN